MNNKNNKIEEYKIDINKISFKNYLNRLLELSIDDNSIWDKIPYKNDLIPINYVKAIEDIIKNKRSLEYIRTFYDIKTSDLTLSFEEIYPNFIKIYNKRFLLEILDNNIDDINDDNSFEITNKLISELSNIPKFQLNTNFELFTDDNYDVDCIINQNFDNIKIGIKYYDEQTPFNKKGNLGMFLFKTGQGKTWLLLNMAITNLKEGLRVGFFHREMTKTKIRERILPLLSDGKLNKNIFYNINKEIVKYIYEEKEKLSNKYNKNFVLMSPNDFNEFSLNEIENAIKINNLDVVLIDYLQLIKDAKDWKCNIAPELSKMAIKYNCSIVVGCQANPGCTREKDLPDSDDSEKNKSFANDFDWVISGITIKTDDDLLHFKTMVAKGRDNQFGKCKFCFDPNTGRIYDTKEKPTIFVDKINDKFTKVDNGVILND